MIKSIFYLRYVCMHAVDIAGLIIICEVLLAFLSRELLGMPDVGTSGSLVNPQRIHARGLQ